MAVTLPRATSAGRLGVVVAAALLMTAGCRDVNAALAQLSEARHLAADLLTEFTRAADAANRAVMAESDAQSVTFAQEADQAKQAVRKDIDALKPLLQDPKYADESRLLQEFVTRFTEYDALDRHVLELAVENTNLQAQRLSFGPAQAEADAFRDAVDAAAAVPARDGWRVKALTATAVASVREIQVLQAPHIADAEDSAMAGIEQRMAAAETAARNTLATLQSLAAPASRPHLVAATAALDRLMALNAQIVKLSRRNSNVRSVALSLDQKRKLIAPCEETLRALRDSLSKHGYPVGRSPDPSRKP
jgi:hypothetical protein